MTYKIALIKILILRSTYDVKSYLNKPPPSGFWHSKFVNKCIKLIETIIKYGISPNCNTRTRMRHKISFLQLCYQLCYPSLIKYCSNTAEIPHAIIQKEFKFRNISYN